ncbi:Hypothetical protein PHPALM_12862 [Phytophthora palmivora]|uniref:Uncharacterized protein n=1 Tax=Phytophthora palmivora TaxID=4796 RepID=A0A2P4XYM7_9STRA|nr:Hypothetical protein PHPALM_12862 [Phytophthora palmivora]
MILPPISRLGTTTGKFFYEVGGLPNSDITSVPRSHNHESFCEELKLTESELIPEKFGDFSENCCAPMAGTKAIKVEGYGMTIILEALDASKVTDPDVLVLVEKLIKVVDKPKRIVKYLQETTGKRVILRDVHILVRRLKSKVRGSDTVGVRKLYYASSAEIEITQLPCSPSISI